MKSNLQFVVNDGEYKLFVDSVARIFYDFLLNQEENKKDKNANLNINN